MSALLSADASLADEERNNLLAQVEQALKRNFAKFAQNLVTNRVRIRN